jgi:hypothetical protein
MAYIRSEGVHLLRAPGFHGGVGIRSNKPHHRTKTNNRRTTSSKRAFYLCVAEQQPAAIRGCR